MKELSRDSRRMHEHVEVLLLKGLRDGACRQICSGDEGGASVLDSLPGTRALGDLRVAHVDVKDVLRTILRWQGVRLRPYQGD